MNKSGIVGEKVRKVPFFAQMLSCSYCTGFHAGWIGWGITRGIHEMHHPVEVLVWAFCSAGVCYLVDSTSQVIESWGRHDPA